MPNRLAGETSPYLLQHKDNPVDWYPWGDDAFAEAQRTGKPLLVSIGYAACHWCHVMAHESFENDEIARQMNEWFVNVKVDREERPDVDALMMTASHYARRGNYIEADRHYTLLREEYPNSPHVQTAFVLGSHVKLMAYQGPAYDGKALQDAEHLKESTIRLYPASEERSRLENELQRIEDAQRRGWFNRTFGAVF